MKRISLLLLLLVTLHRATAQVFADVDTSDADIRSAVSFLTRYLDEFRGKQLPDFNRYWRSASANKAKNPDDMVYSITTDGPTYRFSAHPTIFYAKKIKNQVQLKTMFTSGDTNGHVLLWAITNHYVVLHDSAGGPYFIPQMELRKDLFTARKVRNITYHYPRTHVFSGARSQQLIAKLIRIEQQWGFSPIQMDYYLADSRAELDHLRGLDYNFAMDDPAPSGVSLPKERTIFCQGLAEDYLHEVLHQYFNPLYGSSPLNHGLIYYLAGGIGHDFNWMIHRMNEYLTTYPDTDLGDFENILTKDKMLHIDHTVTGLLCKMIDEKDGVAGLKRALAYQTIDEVFEKEFGIAKKDRHAFLVAAFRSYDVRR